MNLKDHNYNVIIENDNVNYNNDKACSITNNNLEEELIANHVNNRCGVEDTTTGSIEGFKDALIFMITELKDTIQFLRNELEEKNFLVRTLLLRNANDPLHSELMETSLANLEENVDNISDASSHSSSNEINEQLYSTISNFHYLPLRMIMTADLI